jgi:F5/8 type C domain
VREALLLEQAMRAARGYTDGARVSALARAGAEASLVADRALDDGYLASALTVYRDAGLLFMAAAVVGAPASEPVAAELPPAGVLTRFRARQWPGEKQAELEAFCASLAPERAAERPVGAAPARPEVEAARDVVSWLATLVEPRGVAELRVQRGVRVALAGALAVAALAWGISGLMPVKNVALHRPVTASGLFNASINPAGLTDGVIAGAPYGIHTKVGGTQWVQVDLESVRKLDRIVVYNRADGYFDEGLPFTLQASVDGAIFADVETRRTHFSQTDPWVAKANGANARYVRIVAAPGKYVTLSEVEVFAD